MNLLIRFVKATQFFLTHDYELFIQTKTTFLANVESTVQSLKLPDECGTCTIRNSSVALKQWLLVKPKLV